MKVALYDSEDNEMELKPGHVMVMGKDSFSQIPLDEFCTQFVYKNAMNHWDKHYEKAKELICEWGGTLECITSDGRRVNMAQELNRLETNKSEEIHDGNTRDTE